jgi:hypothetical protein
VNRAVAVILALLAAVHVSVLGIPAPVPVLLVFAAVIGALSWSIAAALRCEGVMYWRTT